MPTEIEMVRAARQVIMDVLTLGEPYVPDDRAHLMLDTAKWVIENIWTPDAEAA